MSECEVATNHSALATRGEGFFLSHMYATLKSLADPTIAPRYERVNDLNYTSNWQLHHAVPAQETFIHTQDCQYVPNRNRARLTSAVLWRIQEAL